MEKLTFQGEDGTTEEFYVLEQTRVGGVNYLLVADSEDEDGECLILRDVPGDEEHEIVEDEQEQEGLLAVFEQLLDDVDIER